MIKKKKKGIHTERYRSLDSTKLRALRFVARGRFLCWPFSGTHCTTPGGINSLPLSVDPTLGSKMNCHCYFNRGGRGGGKKGEASSTWRRWSHFDGTGFVARKLEEWHKGSAFSFRRNENNCFPPFWYSVYFVLRYDIYDVYDVWIVESFTMLQIYS